MKSLVRHAEFIGNLRIHYAELDGSTKNTALFRARKYLRLRLGNDPFVIVPPVPLVALERRALLQRLFNYVYPFGHVWAALMAGETRAALT
ncbi:hypothetical protein [Polyangium jinanense]|uniref:Uncharacterized protein n=1 Tax=Polyangium jinanense TaxID=2829994 RepID=A0A9X3X4X8_9BACT|nr:hypothetical protein [Polyangium jinanense]MDC3955691.1 hypothetical protein [Polyangium jinanense]MDC3982333.1 hypothetical protein [Polyangium jinanense]